MWMLTCPVTASSSASRTSKTVVCVAGGPSLLPDDVAFCRDRAFVIAINQSWQLAPWADVLYAADFGWWKTNLDAASFQGVKLACKNQNSMMFGATVLKSLGYLGWSDDPMAVYDGGHSGYQAIQVAAHFGATRIVLLGYDVKASADLRKNWYVNPKTKPFDRWLDTYATLADAAQVRGIEIVNCSRDTALTVFPRQSLAEVLCDLPRSALRA